MTVSDTPPRSAVRDLLIEHRTALVSARDEADMKVARLVADVSAYQRAIAEIDDQLLVGRVSESATALTNLLGDHPSVTAVVGVDSHSARWTFSIDGEGLPWSFAAQFNEAFNPPAPKGEVQWPITIVAVAR